MSELSGAAAVLSGAVAILPGVAAVLLDAAAVQSENVAGGEGTVLRPGCPSYVTDGVNGVLEIVLRPGYTYIIYWCRTGELYIF